MAVNKDEADRCIELAERYIKERCREKAEKFLHKAERLYPSERAKGKLFNTNEHGVTLSIYRTTRENSTDGAFCRA